MPRGDTPACPEWLSAEAKGTWQSLLDGLLAAEIPIRAIDTYAIAMAANCLTAVAVWTARGASPDLGTEAQMNVSRMVQRFQADAEGWLDKIGATPAARMRMGIKGPSKPKGGAIQALLEQRRKPTA